MKYYIGLDGGGTKTNLMVVDDKGNKQYECTGGPSNFLVIGKEDVCNTLYHLIKEAKEKVGFEYKDIASVVLGTTGAGRKADAESLQRTFLECAAEKGAELNDFFVVSDARIALESAFSGKPGSILIAGTGSIMFGKDTKGKVVRIGGFGRFIGDEGSGYVIGRRGLAAAAKNLDGRGGQTLITNLVTKKLNIQAPEDLIIEVYNKKLDIASIAPLVLRAAEQGDKIAKGIIEDESDELLLHINAMQRRLLVNTLDVALIGGIVSSDNLYSKLLRKKVKEKMKDVRIKDADNPPVYGAVLLARERARERQRR